MWINDILKTCLLCSGYLVHHYQLQNREFNQKFKNEKTDEFPVLSNQINQGLMIKDMLTYRQCDQKEVCMYNIFSTNQFVREFTT